MFVINTYVISRLPIGDILTLILKDKIPGVSQRQGHTMCWAQANFLPSYMVRIVLMNSKTVYDME